MVSCMPGNLYVFVGGGGGGCRCEGDNLDREWTLGVTMMRPSPLSLPII